MKYVVAVSGGVDSVALLHMLVTQYQYTVCIAHFDHGIRDESAADARFVAGLADLYDVPFYMERKALGKNASEEEARTARYEFLRTVAQKIEGQIVTAHHADDVIESIAINLSRGTGWRGLAVMGDATINRPLLSWNKTEIYDYALRNNLEWVEDETNSSNRYLRNRIRTATRRLNQRHKDTLCVLATRQRHLAAAIDDECAAMQTTRRYFYTMIDDTVATEMLRNYLHMNALPSLTRPQRTKLLYAIKTAKSGATYQAGNELTFKFTPRDFIVKYPL